MVSFGGQGLNYTLSYTIQVIGGSGAAGQISQISSATNQLSAANTKAVASTTQLGGAMKKTETQMQGQNKAMKGLVFGITGLTSSLVEAVGMLGMYTDASERVTDAQKRLSEATKQYGADSKQARDATAEVDKAERALNMTRRNTILSAFDMVTWITLTITQLKKMDVSMASVGGGIAKLGGFFNKLVSGGVQPAVVNMTNLGTTFSSFAGKVSPVTTAGTALAGSLKTVGPSAMIAAGGVTAVGATSSGAAVGVNVLSAALKVLSANIKLVIASTVIGAAIIGVIFLVQQLQAVADQAKAASEAMNGTTKEMKESIGGWHDITTASIEGVGTALEQGTKDMDEYTKGVLENIQTEITEWKKLPQEVALALAEKRKKQLEDEALQLTKLTELPKDFGKMDLGPFGKADLSGVAKKLFQPLGLTPEQSTRLKTLQSAIKGVDTDIATLKKSIAEAGVAADNLGASGTDLGRILANAVNQSLQGAAAGAQKFVQVVGELTPMVQKGTIPMSVLNDLTKTLGTNLGLSGPALESFNALFKQWVDEQVKGVDDVNAAYANMNIGQILQAVGEQQSVGAQLFLATIDQLGGSAKVNAIPLDQLKSTVEVLGKQMKLEGPTLEMWNALWADVFKKMEPAKEQIQSASDLIEEADAKFKLLHPDMMNIIDDAVQMSDRFSDANIEAEQLAQADFNFKTLHADMGGIIDSTLGLTDGLEDQKNKWNELNPVVSKYMDTSKLTADQLETMQGIYDGLIGKIEEQEQAIQDEKTFWDGLYATKLNDIVATQDVIMANTDLDEIMVNNKKNLLLWRQAMVDGITAARDWFTEIVLGAEKQKAMDASIQLLAKDYAGPLPKGIELTTDELQQLIQAQIETGSSAQKLADIVNNKLAPSLEVTASAVNAESWKEFKDAFKDIDFGDLNKDTKKVFQDLTNDMRKMREEAQEASNVWDFMQVHLEQLSNKDIRRGLDEVSESLKAVGENTPNDEVLGPFSEFIDSLSKKERSQFIQLMGDDMNVILGYLSDGVFTDSEKWAMIDILDKKGIHIADGINAMTDALKEFQAAQDLVNQNKAGLFEPGSLEDIEQLAEATNLLEGIESGEIKLTVDQQLMDATTENTKAISQQAKDLVSNTAEQVTNTGALSQQAKDTVTNTGALSQTASDIVTLDTSVTDNTTALDNNTAALNAQAQTGFGLTNVGFPGPGDLNGQGGGGLAAILQNQNKNVSNQWVDENGVLHIGGSNPNISQRTQQLPQSFNQGPTGLSAFDAQGGLQGAAAKAGFEGSFGKLTEEATKASQGIQTIFSAMFTALTGIFTGIATDWSTKMNSMGTNAASANTQVQTQFSAMYTSSIAIFNALTQTAIVDLDMIAAQSSVDMTGLINNFAAANAAGSEQMNSLTQTSITDLDMIAAQSSTDMEGVIANITAANEQGSEQMNSLTETAIVDFEMMADSSSENMNGVMNNIEAMASDAQSKFDDMAQAFSETCADMANNAKDAAKAIENELHGIPDEDVFVYVHRVELFGKGGVVSTAGHIKAAGGMITTAGPRTITIGDNPGGRETLVAIPHNNPDKWVEMINGMFPGRGSTTPHGARFGGSHGGAEGYKIHVHNHILNRDVEEIWNLERGRMISKYGQ